MPLTPANTAAAPAGRAARFAERLRSLRAGARALGEVARFGAGALWSASPPLTLLFIAASVASGLGPLVQAWATRHLIDGLTQTRLEGTATTPLAPLAPWVAVLLGALVLDNLVAAVTPLLSTHLNERVSQTLERTVYAKTLALPLAAFESPKYYDKLERARRPLGGLAGTLDTLRQFGSGVIAMAGILLLLGTQVHWLVALVLLLGSVPLVRQGVQQNKEFVEINYRQSPQKRRLAYWRDLSTKRGSAAEVRLFGLGNYLLARWRAVNDELLSETFAARRRFARRSVALGWATALVDGATVAGIVLAGMRGAVTAGVIVAALYALRRFEEFRGGVDWQIDYLYEVPVNLRYLLEFVQQDDANDSDRAASGAPVPPSPLQDGIRFEDVSFAYPGQIRPALSGICLHIRPGERLALVGENGAGKSTLARLLLGLYAPTNGRILVDGVDLRQIDPAAWRAQAAAVFQNFVQYQLSARENIGFGNVTGMNDEALIAQAARKSGADAVVEALPAGYDTLLGKGFAGGQDLSLGQWQKLALARAYLREARVLVLDEPAASLDALAEQVVYEQFSRVAQGRTVLLISHRLGSARLADRIVFLEQGRVREVGSHAELVARSGSYAEMYRMQAEWYQEPDSGPAKETEDDRRPA